MLAILLHHNSSRTRAALSLEAIAIDTSKSSDEISPNLRLVRPLNCPSRVIAGKHDRSAASRCKPRLVAADGGEDLSDR